MTTESLKTKLVGPSAKKDFPAMLEQFKVEIARALPKHLNPDRMSRIALTAFRRTPKLGDCDPRSVFAAVIQASQLGLEPDTLGRSYLIPYGKECQFVPGWKGLVDLVNRSGQASVWTGTVFEGDEFEYGLGDRPFVDHKPMGEDDPLKITHVYAIGRVRGSEWPVIEVWPIAKVRKHRDRYNKVGKRHYSYDNWEMYARKVPLLQVIKYMPLSAEMATAVALSDAAEVGQQGITVKDAIDGTWSPVDQEHDEQEVNHASGITETQKQTNESAPLPTYEGIATAIQNSTNLDDLNDVMSLSGAITSDSQMSMLTNIYNRKKEELSK